MLQQTGQLAAAAEHYQHAIAAYPAHAAEQGQLHLQLAECQLLLAHTAAAYATLDAGLRRFPDDPGLLTTLAHGQWRGGDALAAIRTARRLTELDPECVAHWHLLGCFCRIPATGWPPIAALPRCKQRDLSQSESLFRRAQIQARAGRPADARWLLQQVLHHRPDALPAYTLMAQVLLIWARSTRPAGCCCASCAPRPRMPNTGGCWRSSSANVAGRHWRGAHHSALRHDPSHTEAMRMLAWLALEQHDASAGAGHGAPASGPRA